MLIVTNLAFVAGCVVMVRLSWRWMLRPQEAFVARRSLELRACLLVAGLAWVGFALAHVGMRASWTGTTGFAGTDWMVFPLAVTVALGIAHGFLRWGHSRVDQILLPAAALLAVLGLVGVYTWEVRDANAYVSTVALPGLRETRARVATDRTMLPEQRRDILARIGSVPSEVAYEKAADNRAHGRFATVLDPGWARAYQDAARRAVATGEDVPWLSPQLTARPLDGWRQSRKQLIAACLGILLVPAIVLGFGRAGALLRRRREALTLGLGAVVAVAGGAVVLQTAGLGLPAAVGVGGERLTVFDPLKYAIVVLLGLALAARARSGGRWRGRAVAVPLAAAALGVLAILAVDHGAGLALLALTIFVFSLVGGARSRRRLTVAAVAAVVLLPAAIHVLGSHAPQTAQARLSMWADPWGSYERAALDRRVDTAFAGLVAGRADERGVVSRRAAAAVGRDVANLVGELRWRRDALVQREGPNEGPFVPDGDDGDERVLIASEAIWGDLGGYRAVGARARRRIAGATATVVAGLTDRDATFRRTGAAPGTAGEAPTGDNFQLQRGLYALRAGGLLGVGIGQGKPEAIPEVTEDLPAVVLGESLGFVGVALVALLLLLLGLRGVARARRGRSATALILVGLSAALVLQALIALGATIGLFPFTGLTFPLISQSGTSLVASFAAVAVILALARLAPRSGGGPGPRMAWPLRGGGLPAAFALVLAALAALQVGGVTVVPGSLLAGLPQLDAPVAHAADQWSIANYRVAPGAIVDRSGDVLARSETAGSRRSYPDRALSQSLGQTLASLQSSFGRELAEVPPGGAPVGPTLVTTIDAGLQRTVHDAFKRGAVAAGLPAKGLRGAAVAVDTRTGAILALDSRPGFSLDEMEDRSAWGRAESRDRRAGFPNRYLNRAIGGYYPPGSIYKAVTAAGALDAGHRLFARDFDYTQGPEGPRRPDGVLQTGRWHQLDVGGGQAITDGNHPELPDWRFSLDRAFTWSCNVFFAQLGIELGPRGVVRTGRRFGFERRIEVPGLGASRSTLDDDWRLPLARRSLARSRGNLARTSFGQGEVRATPLHMALIPATIANGGVMMQPHIVAGWKDGSGRWTRRTEPRVLQRTGLAPRTVAKLQTMMHNSATVGWARAARVNARNEHPGVGGKTGTAEWAEHQDAAHAWYVGYYPSEAPRVAISVVVERGGLGPTVAARIAQRIFASPAIARYVAGQD